MKELNFKPLDQSFQQHYVTLLRKISSNVIPYGQNTYLGEAIVTAIALYNGDHYPRILLIPLDLKTAMIGDNTA